MKLLHETLQKLTSNNLRIYYDFGFGEDYLVLESKDYIENSTHTDLSRFALRSPKSFDFKTKVTKTNFTMGNISISYAIGDPVTTDWLSTGQNKLFDGLNTFAVCELTGEFNPSKSGYISGDNLMCRINIRSGFEFDPVKVNCLAKYINYYNSYSDLVDKKFLILDQLYSDMLEDFKNSTNSVDYISNKYYVAKLANNPDLLVD